MKERREHHRDNERDSYSHGRKDDLYDVPTWIRLVIYSVKTLGIAAVICVGQFYFMNVTLEHFSKALERQSLSLEAVVITINNNHEEGKEWRKQMLADMRDIRTRLR